MRDILGKFEAIARRAHLHTDSEGREEGSQHPFDIRNIHDAFPSEVQTLFDNGHYAQATFEAFKFIDKAVQGLAKLSETGFKLMMQAFSETSPLISLTPCSSVSEKDEQKGYQFLFAGSMLAVRNPRGHDLVRDTPDECLDHLALASTLLRRLEKARFFDPLTDRPS